MCPDPRRRRKGKAKAVAKGQARITGRKGVVGSRGVIARILGGEGDVHGEAGEWVGGRFGDFR